MELKPGYKQTEIEVIPDDWKEVRLGEHASFLKGNGLSKSQLIADGQQRCIHYGELFTHYGPVIENVTSRCLSFEGSCLSIAGDVLMPGSDVTPRGLATASAVQMDDVVLGGDVIVIRPNRMSFFGPFLANLIRINRGKVLRLVKGSTVYHIHAKDLSDLEVLLPPFKEQKAIAEALSDVDALIDSLEALLTKKRNIKTGVMQELLTGRTRLPGFSGDWREVRLGKHVSFLKGNGLSKSQLIADGQQRCIHYGELFTHYGPVIENVTSRCLSFEGSCLSIGGDVLMPGSDVTPRGLATASAVQMDGVVLGGDVIVIRPNPMSFYGPFLANFIRMNREEVLRLVKGSTVYHIHAKDLSDLEVLLPPVNEQKAIAEVLSDIDDEIEALDKRLAKTRDLKQGMAQELLTGRTRLV